MDPEEAEVIDNDENDEFELMTEEEDEAGEETEEEDEDEDEDEEKAEPDERDKELEALRQSNEKLQKDNNRLGYALRHQSKEKEKEKDPGFTDQQLVGLMREHKDDPDVLFQVVKQMVKQEGTEVKKAAVDSAETARVKQNLDGFLDEKFPDWRNTESEVRGHIDSTMEGFQLKDHPFGEFLSMAAHIATNVDKIIEDHVKEAKSEALKEKAESSRKKNIKKNSLSKSKKTEKKAALPDDYKEVADQMGLTESQRKIYAKMRKAGSNQITVGA